MNPQRRSSPPAGSQHEDQRVYARLLGAGTWLALATGGLAMLAYALAWTVPRVPPADLARLWRLPVAEFVQRSGMQVGWGWLRDLPRADMLGLLAIALLASCSILPVAVAAWRYGRRGERAMAGIAAAQALVMALAASGLLSRLH